MYRFDTNGQMTMLGLDTAERGGAPPKRRPGKPDSELVFPLGSAVLSRGSLWTAPLGAPISMAGRQAAPQYRGRAPPPDPRLTVWHTGSVPVSKVLFIENRLSGHPAPRL